MIKGVFAGYTPLLLSPSRCLNSVFTYYHRSLEIVRLKHLHSSPSRPWHSPCYSCHFLSFYAWTSLCPINPPQRSTWLMSCPKMHLVFSPWNERLSSPSLDCVIIPNQMHLHRYHLLLCENIDRMAGDKNATDDEFTPHYLSLLLLQ